MDERTTEKRTRKKIRLNKRNVLMVVLPAVVAVAAVAIVLFTTSKAASFVLNGDAYQAYAGGIEEFPGGTELVHNEDGTSSAVKGNMPMPLNGLPVYFTGRYAALIPEDMLYYDARNVFSYKADYFTEAGISEYGDVTFTRAGNEKGAPRGFLYDGSDVYLFLEPMMITFNEAERELDALSYVEAVLGDHIMIYDHANNKCYMEQIDGGVTARQVSGDYMLDLLYDRLELANGEKSLLFSRTEGLNSIYD